VTLAVSGGHLEGVGICAGAGAITTTGTVSSCHARQARRSMPPAGPLSVPEQRLSLQPHGKTAEIQALDGGEGIGLVLVRFWGDGIPGRDHQKQGDGAPPDPPPAADQNGFTKFCKKVIAVPTSPPFAR
jgi:hypothetical protein